MTIKPYVVLVFFSIGCTSTTNQTTNDKNSNDTPDTRPSSELLFIKKLSLCDSVYQSGVNDIQKDEALKEGKQSIIQYVDDTLQFQAKEWQAFVNEITIKEFGTIKYIDVKLLIPKDNVLESENPQDNSTVLYSQVALSGMPKGGPYDKKIKDKLSVLSVGDKVSVTGSFYPSEITKHIDFIANGYGKAEYTFANARFVFVISDIKKMQN